MRPLFFSILISLLLAAWDTPSATGQPELPPSQAKQKKGKNGPKQGEDKKESSGQKKKGSPEKNSVKGQESPTTAPKPSSDPLDDYLNAPRRIALGKTPPMFGDWFRPGLQLFSGSETPGGSNSMVSLVQIPLSARVGKVSENNSALPYDRVFFNYNYFHNALRGNAVGPVGSNSSAPSLEKYTLGWERTLLDGKASIESRFVISNTPDFVHNPLGPGPDGYETFNPTLGNLALIGKILLFENASTALAAGTAIEVPTGGDTRIESGLSRLEIQNQAVYLAPYIGLLKKPTDSPWFANAFVQLETPLCGDRVRLVDPVSNTTNSIGNLTPQTALFIDVAVGRWLHRQPGNWLSGAAALVEAHYNMGLNDSDSLTGAQNVGAFASAFTINPLAGRFNVLDLTAGLHLEIADRTRVRLGAVFPVGDEKPFDGELGLQVSRYR
ncbi:MAG: hypothetical protein VX768_07925 [Planctomycetota bacterium]|nr:hypothetical protein [Planctomycetota bacterium]